MAMKYIIDRYKYFRNFDTQITNGYAVCHFYRGNISCPVCFGQIFFQNPASSWNPRIAVFKTKKEAKIWKKRLESGRYNRYFSSMSKAILNGTL